MPFVLMRVMIMNVYASKTEGTAIMSAALDDANCRWQQHSGCLTGSNVSSLIMHAIMHSLHACSN